MKPFLKKFIKRIPLSYPSLKDWIISRKQKRELIKWEKQGRPAPPPHIVKQHAIRNFAKTFHLNIFIETGTFLGEMVEAMKPHFNQIYSIELSKELFEKAQKKFDGDNRIKIIRGDSGTELSSLVDRIEQPALFWLDGHYSGGETAKGEKDTPIYEELTHIFNSRQNRHVVIIDDARLFGTDSAYPSFEELSDFIKEKSPGAKIEVKNDSIRIIPRSQIKSNLLHR